MINKKKSLSNGSFFIYALRMSLNPIPAAPTADIDKIINQTFIFSSSEAFAEFDDLGLLLLEILLLSLLLFSCFIYEVLTVIFEATLS